MAMKNHKKRSSTDRCVRQHSRCLPLALRNKSLWRIENDAEFLLHREPKEIQAAGMRLFKKAAVSPI